MNKSSMFAATVAAMAMCISANAQLKNDTEGWRRLGLSYTVRTLSEESNANIYKLQTVIVDPTIFTDNGKSKGFALEYMQGVNVTNKIPLFLEPGIQAGFYHATDDKTQSYAIDHELTSNGDVVKYEWETEYVEEDYTIKRNYLNISIPVNVAYKFAFESSENFTIVPFIGPNFKFNLLGVSKYASGGETAKINHFKDTEVLGNEKARRLQVGLNLGIGVNICQKLYVGYKFQPDFHCYYKSSDEFVKNINNALENTYYEVTAVDSEVKSKTQFLTVGLNF